MWSKNKSGVAETQTGPYHPLKEKKRHKRKASERNVGRKIKQFHLGRVTEEMDRGVDRQVIPRSCISSGMVPPKVLQGVSPSPPFPCTQRLFPKLKHVTFTKSITGRRE